MKKITILAVAAIAVLSLSSCTKNYTCTCTSTSVSTDPRNHTSQPTMTDAVALNKVSKEAAELNCQPGTNTKVNTYKTDSINYTVIPFQTVNYSYTVTDTRTCTLK